MSLRSLSFAALTVALLATPVLTQAANVSARSTATAQAAKSKSSKPSGLVQASLVQERMTAQQKLTAAGDYSGPIDGKRTIAYVTALKSFQTQHHLHASGHLNKATLAAFSA